MILVLKAGTIENDLADVYEYIKSFNVRVKEIQGESTHMLGLVGDTSSMSENVFASCPQIERIIRIQEPYKLAGRKFHPNNSVYNISGRTIGADGFTVIAGPCSVEGEEQIVSIAEEVKACGAQFLRGGAFKPRTSPYAFNGLGLDGLELLQLAKRITGLPLVSEIMSPEYLDLFARNVDIIQIGARNMQNYTLLRQVGELGKPVLLKRGISSTIDELLMAAEHIMMAGSEQIILCERGIRTFETSTRNTLDLSAVPVIQARSHLPVFIDPSHATGYWPLVEPMALAAAACGANGLIVEVHNDPERALCDGAQSLTPKGFGRLMKRVIAIRKALDASEEA